MFSQITVNIPVFLPKINVSLKLNHSCFECVFCFSLIFLVKSLNCLFCFVCLFQSLRNTILFFYCHYYKSPQTSLLKATSIYALTVCGSKVWAPSGLAGSVWDLGTILLAVFLASGLTRLNQSVSRPVLSSGGSGGESTPRLYFSCW